MAAEREAALKEAADRGYAEGLQRAQKEINKKVSELENKQQLLEEETQSALKSSKTQFTAAIEAINAHGVELEKLFESRLVSLTLECLYKLAGRKEIYKEVVEEAIKRHLTQAPLDGNLYVRLPQSHAVHFESLATALEGRCVFIFDSKLKPGDCFIENGFTTEDSSLTTLLNQIKDSLSTTLETRLSNAGD